MESWKSKYNQEMGALQAALERKSTELSSCQSECKNLQSELDAARLTITKLREELDNLRMKFERELAEAESRYNGVYNAAAAHCCCCRLLRCCQGCFPRTVRHQRHTIDKSVCSNSKLQR